MKEIARAVPGYRPLRTALWYATWYAKEYVAVPPLYLLGALPRTWWRLLRDFVFVPDGRDDPILAYAYNTASDMRWYDRLARNIAEYGPNGYAYNDALGTAFGDRFFQHYLSYGLLWGKLGSRRYTVLAGTIMLASIIVMGILTANVPLSLFVMLIVAGSPAFVMSLFHLTKPENLGWALLPLTVFFMARAETLPAALSLLLLSMTSITMTVPAIGFAGLMWLSGQLPLLSLIIIGVPTGLKTGWQFLKFLRRVGLQQFTEVLGGSGSSSTLTSEVYKRYLREITYGQRVWVFVQILLTIALLLSNAPWGYAAATLMAALLLVINYRGFRWADQTTFVRIFLAYAVSIALLYPAPWHLVVLGLALLALHPRVVMEAGGLDMNHVIDGDQLAKYPYQPIRLGQAALQQVAQCFAEVPAGSRLAWQSLDPFGANLAGYRPLNSVLECLLNDRHLELLPGVWLRATQTQWYLKQWAKLDEATPPDQCTAICESGGIQYLLVVSDAFARQLAGAGYQVIGQLAPDLLRQTCLGERCTVMQTVHLLKVPGNVTQITPETILTREPNRMSFEAKAGTYFVRYNYHPAWRGTVNGQPIEISPGQRDHLKGMEIVVPVDGLVQLEFKDGWLH